MGFHGFLWDFMGIYTPFMGQSIEFMTKRPFIAIVTGSKFHAVTKI